MTRCACGLMPLLRETRDGMWVICCEDTKCPEQVLICRKQRDDVVAQWDAFMAERPTLPEIRLVRAADCG